MLDGFGFGDVFFYTFFAAIETDFTTCGSYITIIGIRHLSGTIDDTTHDSNLQPLELRCSFFHFGNCLFKIIQCATTTGA